MSTLRRYLLLMLGSTVLALGLLYISTADHTPAWLAETDPALLRAALRQQVMIVLVDTSDAFDHHGDAVQEVVRQQCDACRVELVNLHGDLSQASLVDALERVLRLAQGQSPATTVLVNVSLGSYAYDALLHARVRALDSAGILVIAAVGNDHTQAPFYPAAFPEAFGVCSITRYTRAKAAYSNFGPWVSLCAPGLQYVARPAQPGELVSGTSFASPMVAGALGHLLLDTPCASPRAGLRALRRTADPAPEGQVGLGAGLLNATKAQEYLQRLYPCQAPSGAWPRLRTRLERLGTGAALYLGLLVYFFVSIFALPFGLAFGLNVLERRAAHRHWQAFQRAYEGSPAYRQARLQALRAVYARRQRLRPHEQAEAAVLLHAVYLAGESCLWCGREARTPVETGWSLVATYPACSRCGWDLRPGHDMSTPTDAH